MREKINKAISIVMAVALMLALLPAVSTPASASAGLTVTAANPSSVGKTGVTLNATVSGLNITAQGFYYSTTQYSDAGLLVADVGTVYVPGTKNDTLFSAALTGLTQGTTYYWVAYATNSIDTRYSAVQTLNSYAVTFSGSGCTVSAAIGETTLASEEQVFSSASVTFTAADAVAGTSYAWTVGGVAQSEATSTLTLTVSGATDVTCTAAPLFSLVTPGSAYNATTNPIAISSADDLTSLAALVNAGSKVVVNSNGTPIAMDATSASYRLTADIALNSDTSGYAYWGTSAPTNSWTPIGTYTSSSDNKPFSGTFDGGIYSSGTLTGNHTISGIYINNDSNGSNNKGLFGYIVTTGTVKNVNVTESYIKGSNAVGAIAGCNNGSISGCNNSGNVSGKWYVGGIAGNDYVICSAYESSISGCCNTGTVTAQYQNAGGITGYMSGNVINCYNAGFVNCNDTTGGIVGNSSATVQFCYNMGTVGMTTGSGSYIGGIAGFSRSDALIEYCYNAGGVIGYGSLGGIAGYCYNSVQYCYSSGTLRANDKGEKIGGIVGYATNTATVKNCYYDKQMCPYEGVNGADDETKNVVGKLTTDMIGQGLSTLLGTSDNWVFTSDATAANNPYPMLKNMNTTDAAKVSASPIFLTVTDSSKYETANRVKSSFTVSTVNSTSWASSADSVISVSGTAATFVTAGSVTLTATIGSISKAVKLTAVANTDPSFVDTGAGSVTIKENATATDVAALLHVSDPDEGQTLTWSQATSGAPSHGTLTIGTEGSVTVVVPATGNTDIAPTTDKITYTPNADFEGTDSFTIQVSDAQGGTAKTRTINVTVDGTAPTITMSAKEVKGGVKVKASSSEKGTVYLVSNALNAGDIDTATELEALVTGGTATKATISTAASDKDISAPSAEGTYAAVAADEVGNVSVKSTNQITVDNTAPTIVSAKVSSDYKYIDVTFSEGIYSGAYTPVSAPAILTFKQNDGTATGVTITLVTQTDGKTELEGGETTVRLFIAVARTPSGKETIEITPTNGSSIYDKAGNCMAGAETTGEKVLYTPITYGGGDSSTPGVSISVDGQSQLPGTSQASTNSDGKTVKTVTVDSDKLESAIESGEKGTTVTLPVTGGPAVAQGVINGKVIKSMENKEDVLVVKTDSASYTLPASEIDIDAVSNQFGTDVSLSDITVTVSISEPSDAMAKVIENAAEDGGFTIAVPAVEYSISCSYGGKSVEVSSFNSYVQRTIAIPDGVDPSKVTTGIVVDPDGTVHHVPTRITVIDGKYYAVINSLTNSAYSVVWNPVAFADVTNHWAKAAINNMGSRMVVTGMGDGNYAPDRDITRAEFATVIVRALGLEPGSGASCFSDVSESDWYCGYVKTASGYGLITGYTGGTFGPNDKITREQAMTIIARAMKITKLDTSTAASDVTSLLAGFKDGSSVSSYAKEGIAACVSAGLVNGKGSSIIAPQDNITRAEVAVIVERLLQKSELI